MFCWWWNQEVFLQKFLHIWCSWLVLLCVSEEERGPQYFTLTQRDDEKNKICLATGFTRHKLTKDMPWFNETEPSQIKDKDGKPTGVYNQVALLKNGSPCEGEPESVELLTSSRHDGISCFNYWDKLMTSCAWFPAADDKTDVQCDASMEPGRCWTRLNPTSACFKVFPSGF